MDWRRAEDYRFTAGMDAAGWAWQFLRRCEGYRADYAWFMATWRELEADYGKPPERDFFRWKRDRRAWRAESEISGCGADTCPGENDQVLIECWMGAKWGFRKFPIDPAEDFPVELAWREQPLTVERLTAGEIDPLPPARVALGFDLSLPLDGQLAMARRELALLRHGLAQSGALPPPSLKRGAPRWTLWLRLLDARDAGAFADEIGPVLDLADPSPDLAAALAMSRGGYRRILMLGDEST